MATERRRIGFGLRGMFKGSVTNRLVTPSVVAEVWHVGKNDYRVVFLGIGEHSAHHQLNPAFSKAQWLGMLQQADLNHEIAKAQVANDKRGVQ
jgi:hypothetical protein